MPIHKDSLFRIFQADYRTALWRFFENRHDRMTADLAAEFCDRATLERLLGMELLQYDGASNEYRLDDRIERFIEEMLGAAEVAQADWLAALLEELRRVIEGIGSWPRRARATHFSGAPCDCCGRATAVRSVISKTSNPPRTSTIVQARITR